MKISTMQNSVDSYQQGFKDGKNDMALTIFFIMYVVVSVGLGIISYVKDIPILGIISVILGFAIIFVPMLLGAYYDYRKSSKTDKRIIRIITTITIAFLIFSILLVN